jgi:hypothetical protein
VLDQIHDPSRVPESERFPGDITPSDRAIEYQMLDLIAGRDRAARGRPSSVNPDVIVELMGTTFPRDRKFVEQVTARAARPELARAARAARADFAGRVRMIGHVEDPLDRLRAGQRRCPAALPAQR